MGIQAARAKLGKAEPRPNAVIEIVEGVTATFREPRSTDLSVPPAAEAILRGKFPFMPAPRRLEVNLLARCYVPDEGETKVEALEEFGSLSEEQDRVFCDLLDGLSAAFPEFTDWISAKAAAKNVSGES